MWFYLSAFIVLLGAELNAEVERQPELNRARDAQPAADLAVNLAEPQA